MGQSRRDLLTLALFSPSAGVVPPGPPVTGYPAALDLDLPRILPPAPAHASPDEAAELRAIVTLQAAATPARIAEAVADVATDPLSVLQMLLGLPPHRPELADTAAITFLARLSGTISDVARLAHADAVRVPPWLTDSAVRPLVPEVRRGSYPSVYAMRATMLAVLLNTLEPAQASDVWKRAAAYGESRVIGGMEFPSDVAAGRLAGVAVSAVLAISPLFRTDLDKVRPALLHMLGL